MSNDQTTPDMATEGESDQGYTPDEDPTTVDVDADDTGEGDSPTPDSGAEEDETVAGPAEQRDPGNENPATTSPVE